MKWTEMNCKEKLLTIAYMIAAAVTIVFAVAEFSGLMENAGIICDFSFAALCALECARRWKTKRTVAILELVCAILLLGCGIVSIVV